MPISALAITSHVPLTAATTAPPVVCMPLDAKLDEAAAALIAWMKARPELQDQPYMSGLLAAARALYPCAAQLVPAGDFEAAADIRSYVLRFAIPMGMANVEGEEDDKPDMLLGWRLAKDKNGNIAQVPDMFSIVFNDTGAPFPDFGGQPKILADVFVRRSVRDKPPSGHDDDAAKTGVPALFIGASGEDVWEVGRHGGTISVRLVGQGVVGPWEGFESDPARYHYYAQHFLHGRTAQQNFLDPKVAALTLAACAGDKAAVASAVRSGADSNGKGVDGDTPIFWAVDCANADGIEALLRAGADPNYKLPGRSYAELDASGGAEGRTHRYAPLFPVIFAHNLALVQLLVKYGADPNSYEDDKVAETAISIAASRAGAREALKHDSGGWLIYEALLDADKDLNHADANGATLATQLARSGHHDRVEELLKRGYDYDLVALGWELQMWIRSSNGARERAMEILGKKGVCFPLRSLLQRGATLTMEADETLRVQWDKPAPGCLPQKDGPALLGKKAAPSLYRQFLQRAGGMQPGETKTVPPESKEEIEAARAGHRRAPPLPATLTPQP